MPTLSVALRRMIASLPLLGLLAATSTAAAPAGLWSPGAEELAALHARNDARWQRLFPDGQLRPRADTREVAALALDTVAGDGDPQRVATMLDALRAQQDAQPDSPTFGNLRWYAGDEKIVDRNGVEFVTRHASVLWWLYRDRLSAPARASLRAMLALARTGIARHKVAVSYTNIFLMEAWNLVALGQGLDDPALAAQGRDMLREWLAWTARNGIAEYLSPTYYAVDLECLALIRNLARDAETQALAQRALDALWSDVALHWYAPSARLGGTHSRDYDRLFAHGDLDKLVQRAGWSDGRAGIADIGPYATVAWSAPSPAATRWLNTPLPRMISARWGEDPSQRMWHYLAHDFSIASTEAGYNTIDTAPMAVSLGSGRDAPVITYFMDGRRDYYGKQRIVEPGSGHPKPLHLRPFLSSVQNGPSLLFLASGRQDKVSNAALESVITLPADAEYWLDGKHLDLYTYRSRWQFEPAPNGDTTRIDVLPQDGRDVIVLEDRDATQGVGISQIFAVQAGHTYQLSARFTGGDIALYLNFLDAKGQRIGPEHFQRVRGVADPVRYGYAQTAPVGAVSCRAWLYSAIAMQTRIVLSDLAFEELDPTNHFAQPLGRFDFRRFVPQQIAIPTGANLVLRRQGAALALRILGAWDVRGKPIEFKLVNDGLAYGAVRLTATHADGNTPDRGTVAVWVRAQGSLTRDEAFAAFRRRVATARHTLQLDGDILDVDVFDDASQLALRVDLAKGERLLRSGGSSMPEISARALDGRDIGIVAAP